MQSQIHGSGSGGIAVGGNGYSALSQNQPGGNGSDVFSVSQSMGKGGMRGLGVVLNMIAEIALKNKAIGIAEDYYNTNKTEYAQFKSVHLPAMQASITEAFGADNPEYVADLYASVPSGMAKAGIIDRQWFEARRRIPKYNTGQARKLDYEMTLARMHAVVGGWNLAWRYEQEYADRRNDRRFNRKAQMANLGIGFGNSVRAGMGAASTRLASAYDRIGDTIATIGNGYAARKGYEAGRDYAASRHTGFPGGTQ